MMAELDPDGSLKEMMGSLSDPSKLSDPNFLAEMQSKLMGNKDYAVTARTSLSECLV